MITPRFTPIVAHLPHTVPFRAPEALERQTGQPFRARLGANESAFGPSPQALQAIAQAAGGAWMYGDPEAHELRHAIAAHHGVAPENIILGEGIDGLLGLLVRMIIGPGDVAVTSSGAYPTFNYHVTGHGGQLAFVPYLDDHEDPDALAKSARAHGAKLVYLANPDNPMGSWHPAARVTALIDALPEGCLLVLDEAYVDLAPPGTAPDIAANDPRVIRMRTFSKGYGLAGLRVGYAIADTRLIASFDKVRNHFALGRVAQAGALAALHDPAWLALVQARVAEGRAELARIAAQNGLRALPSATNFVTIDCGRDGTYARAVLAALADDGVFVRMPGVAPLDRAIRVTVGLPDALAVFADSLPRALAQARANAPV